jgi:anti-anti-sigma regulatory factor
MKIDTTRTGSSVLLQLEGRLDREWAEHLSSTIERLLQEGVRSLRIDFAAVTYASSAAPWILARWQQELAILRGEVQLISLPPAMREVFTDAGWGADLEPGPDPTPAELRRSSWHSRRDFAASGVYEFSSVPRAGTLACRLHGDPGRLSQAVLQAADCSVASFPDLAFGLGIGAIGDSFAECHPRLGELVAAAGCVAYFPTDGARQADFQVGGGPAGNIPRALLASGMVCQGGFTRLVRFSTGPDAGAVLLSELAAVSLDAAGGGLAGMVIVGETAGLTGARLLRSPALGTVPLTFEAPALREWLQFAPERTHAMTTSVIVAVVGRRPNGPIAAHLRPVGSDGKLMGHFHAAVFAYHPLPQRTVELPGLLKGIFANHQLRDVLHLVWDDRGEAGVAESALLRGVAWVAPITEVG